ncbi:MAG: IS66 family transposase [Candidatus Fimisoma sp.]
MKDKGRNIDFSAMSRKEIEEYAMNLTDKVEQLSMQLSWYEEQIRLSRQKRFGASSEKTVIDQISLFNEAESESQEEKKEPAIGEVKPPATGKKKGHKDKLLKPLQKETITYTLSEEDKICPVCGEKLHEMKKEIRKELVVIPAKYIVREHVTYSYACRNCEKTGTEGTVVKAESPNGIFRNSIVSASLLSDIITKKYLSSLPLYRQEQGLKLQGLRLSRQTMANWIVRAGMQYLKPLYDLLHEELVKREVIHADETTLEVLNEPGRDAHTESYMWLYRTGGCDKKRPIVLYDYQPSRSGDHPKEFLKGFCGYLQTDGYSGYHKVTESNPDVLPVGCMAHARRKFDEALKALPKDADAKHSKAAKGLSYCNQLFAVEHSADEKHLSYDERKAFRLDKAKPIFEEFLKWAKETEAQVLPKSKLHDALQYVINQEKPLKNYMLDGRIELSNNRAERSIKPFVIGRKNWLFSNTPKGATASAIIYSIMETAKESGLNPFEYFKYLFEELPNVDMNDKSILKRYLPYAQTLPAYCKQPEDTIAS